MNKKSKIQFRGKKLSHGSDVGNRQPEFNPDYSHVVKDLRRIGILAGSFITILVVLSFFLR